MFDHRLYHGYPENSSYDYPENSNHGYFLRIVTMLPPKNSNHNSMVSRGIC